MDLADSVKVSRDSTYSGYFGRRPDFAYGALTLYDSAVPNGFHYPIAFLLHYEVLLPRLENQTGLGYSAFARRYLRNRFFFLFLWYLDVSVLQVGYARLWIQRTHVRVSTGQLLFNGSP